MKRFQFRLATVLRHAEQCEHQLKLEQAWLLIQKHQHEVEVALLSERRKMLRTSIVSTDNGYIDIDTIETQHRHLQNLDNAIAAERVEIENIEHQWEQKTAEVVEIMRKRQTLENLRERAKQDYDIAVVRDEIKLIDDIMIPRLAGGTR
jgi:flagellar export protein FliJ